jgi:hypothetical protein
MASRFPRHVGDGHVVVEEPSQIRRPQDQESKKGREQCELDQ